MPRSILLGLLCGFALLIGGCASAPTIDSWKAEVDHYVDLHGGDPNALRDMTLSDGRRGFAVIGQNDPRHSTDVRALLLAHESVLNRPTFIYLLGIVKDEDVKEMRLAARTQQPDRPAAWAIGPADKQALKLYQQYARRTAGDNPHPLNFPRASDQFEVKIDGPTITATHRASGAQWQLDVNAPKK